MKHFFSSRAQLYSLIFIIVAMLPALGQVNPVLLIVLAFPVLLHQQIKKNTFLRWGILIAVLTGCLLMIQLGSDGWLSGKTVLEVLLSVLILKWAESETAREFNLAVLASVVLAALSSLYLPSFPAMAYLLLVGASVLICLISIQDTDFRLNPKQLWKNGLGISLLLLPVTVVLFITMPRVQGPLWDLGIVIGLPIELAIDQNSRDIGLKGSLRAGEVSRLKKDDSPVLVAEFSGSVPYKSRMYWRGPVFSYYDGIKWTLPDGWDKRSNLLKGSFRGEGAVEQVLTSKRDKVYYEARVSPHSGHWLYALDMPTGQTPEALISKDMQLLGIRNISWEFKYDISAWLEYTGGRKPTAQGFADYLAYPDVSNPRLKAFGQALAIKYGSVQERIDVLYTHFASHDYQMSLTSDIEEGRNNLDQYFFDKKVGTIEHLASSTALVLRAAGIPTRLITGYRGGSLIALTNFVVVKQEHAHVWVEAWRDDIGWQRIEAKDLVVPPEKNSSSPSAQKQSNKVPANTKKESPVEAASVSKKKVTAEGKQKKEQAKSEVSYWRWLKKLSTGVETWVLNYNPDRQVELLKKSGLRIVNWKNLLALSCLSVLFLMFIYVLFLHVKKTKTDPVAQAFAVLNKRFLKFELACHDRECPSQWLLRVKTERPELYPVLRQVVEQYLALQYGGENSVKNRALFVRDVKRLVAMI